MIDIADFAGIGELAACLVQHQRVGIPAVPELANHVQEFIGAVVAGVVLQMLIESEIARLGIVQ